ncbi:uncharacterized protein PG986_011556 [Apiospora aurea]|uniref:Uncharacterized protein n=1 Tax=Apiospora aurea TaxID=335848 RepID=A0ABR1PXJ4_9PEZI
MQALRGMMAAPEPPSPVDSKSSEDSYPDIIAEEPFEYLSADDVSGESEYLQEEAPTPPSSSEANEEEELPVEDADERVSVPDERAAEGVHWRPGYAPDPWRRKWTQAATKEEGLGVRAVAGGGAFYYECDRPYTIRLAFRPDPNDASSSYFFSNDDDDLPSSGWWAEMFIKCASVPELMKQGLHWSGANIVPEEGRIVFNPSRDDKKQYQVYCQNLPAGWQPRPRGPKTRHYYLKSFQGCQPGWVANLQVHSDNLEVLSRFRPADLTRDKNLSAALAYATDGSVVYSWRSHCPHEAFNALYDGMPMQGWWPSWSKAMPKEEEEEEEEGEPAARPRRPVLRILTSSCSGSEKGGNTAGSAAAAAEPAGRLDRLRLRFPRL